MNYELAKVIADYTALIIAILAFLYSWWSRRTTATQTELKELRTESSGLDKRVGVLEREISFLPTNQAIHELAVSLEQNTGSIKEMGARLEGLDGIVKRLETMTDRQEDWLLRQGTSKS